MWNTWISDLEKGGFVPFLSGDPGWIRTIDLPLRRRPLYPLSYEAIDLSGLWPKNPCHATDLAKSAGKRKGGVNLAHHSPLGPSRLG